MRICKILGNSLHTILAIPFLLYLHIVRVYYSDILDHYNMSRNTNLFILCLIIGLRKWKTRLAIDLVINLKLKNESKEIWKHVKSTCLSGTDSWFSVNSALENCWPEMNGRYPKESDIMLQWENNLLSLLFIV